MNRSSAFDSAFFNLQQLSDGVFAAVSKEGTGSWSNAGIIDLGNRTCVFDTFATPQAAVDLRKAAEIVTGRVPSFVINSHAHIDHYHGNQVFRDATIIATSITREQIATRYPRFSDSVKRGIKTELIQLSENLKHESEASKRRETAAILGELTAISQTIESAELVLPTITFEERLDMHGTVRHVSVVSYGGGHSPSDAFLYLPEEKIAFLADLLHIGYHGEFSNGNPDEWICILQKIQQLDIKIVVSGHGTIGTSDDLVTMLNYLTDLKEYAAEWINSGGTVANVEEAVMPEKYKQFAAPSVFHRNLSWLLQHQC